ncbi:hypothetical protein KUTeg_014468 [Tegillarca granosa]|uniref:Dehydrogenase/reductase SDR family member 7 n=1 Tax=Tegillarca granosa TaxID=220873 RepID=A0ABQ9EWN3_TEGGR|nr:hypothetical protein KUTeg_014468 [Tegillarca granosa]
MLSSLELVICDGNGIQTLSRKVIWITGASSGIGEALAYRLATAGCKIIISARRKDRLETLKQKCLETGQLTKEDVLILPLDLQDFESHKEAVAIAIKYFKCVDVLVNNAGRSQRALFEKTSFNVDRQLLEINTLGTISLTKALLPHMVEQKSGHIVVTSSIAGKHGVPGLCSYSASKHALHGWFDSFRIEAYRYNIGVTMVCPGPVFSEALTYAFTENTEKVRYLITMTVENEMRYNDNSIETIQDELLGVVSKPGEKRIPTSRCAHLIAVAIANKLDEVWITFQPELFYCYLFQYLPLVAFRL